MFTRHQTVCQHVVLLEEDDVVVAGVTNLLATSSPDTQIRSEGFEELLRSECALGTVVLYDAAARGWHGVDELERLVVRLGAPVAVFSDALAVEYLLDCLRVGARGYISKATDGALLARHLNDLAGGMVSIDPVGAGQLAEFVLANPPDAWPGRSAGLSRRESEVMGLIARGMTNREIATRLIIGAETVKSHAVSIYRKLGTRSRNELIAQGVATDRRSGMETGWSSSD